MKSVTTVFFIQKSHFFRENAKQNDYLKGKSQIFCSCHQPSQLLSKRNPSFFCLQDCARLWVCLHYSDLSYPISKMRTSQFLRYWDNSTDGSRMNQNKKIQVRLFGDFDQEQILIPQPFDIFLGHDFCVIEEECRSPTFGPYHGCRYGFCRRFLPQECARSPRCFMEEGRNYSSKCQERCLL